MRAVAVGFVVFWTLASLALAQEAAGPPKTVPLDGVTWAGAPVSLDALKGKTVVVLAYASWCPICNKWSGELFEQLKEAVSGKPAVILAIYSDKSPEAAQGYVTERGFLGPNILHGFDPAMHTKLGFDSNLFRYVLIDPSGAVVERGSAGSYFGGENAKKFALAQALAQPKTPGKFNVMAAGMSEPVCNLLWPLELGVGSESAISKGRAALSAEQKQELDTAVERFMDAGVEEIKGLYKGSVPQRFEAYDKASQLAGMFKTTAQSKKARDVVAYLEKDEAFKRELAAKKAYDGCVQKGGPAGRRDTLLRSIAKRFEGTHYGSLAAESAEKKP